MGDTELRGEAGDAAVLRATGRDWNGWLEELDRWGATARTHREIARYLQEERGLSGWWAQQVTVGYERARGMRAVHQVADGFSASVSKTMAVSAEAIFALWTQESERDRWLPAGTLTPRSASPGKSARFDAVDGSRVDVNLSAKGADKTAVQVQVTKLPDASAVEAAKAVWRAHLERLLSFAEVALTPEEQHR